MERTTRKHNASCAAVPDFTRLRYFYGQMLSAQDFQIEQDYFREKLKLHNRCLHGYGVVCGLEVRPEPIDPSCESDEERRRAEVEKELAAIDKKIKEASGAKSPPAKKSAAQKASENLDQLRARAEELRRELDELDKICGVKGKRTAVEIDCGMALDCCGNELIVRRSLKVDLLDALGADNRSRYETPQSLWISLCFCEQSIDPVRPVAPDSCGANDACTYGKLRDSVHVKVSLEAPEKDERCETCCEGCADHCVLLARIDEFQPGKALTPEQIHNEARRAVGTYEPTTITGVSWTQGASYSPDDADDLLTQMEVRFSKEVLISSITRGVVDMWVVEGGATRRSGIYSLEVEYDLPDASEVWTDRLKFHYAGDENLDPGDRLLITIRGGFILDRCCRPVNGINTGGRTPLIPGDDYKKFARETKLPKCISPPPGFGPWYSGVASPGGGNFEGWFFVEDDHNDDEKGRRRPRPRNTEEY
jgi:hypothetical protein